MVSNLLSDISQWSGITRLAPKRKKIEQRQLLIVVCLEDDKLYVLTAEDERLTIPVKVKSRKRLFEVLRGPWPLICDMNLVSLGRVSSFVHDHVECDVVKVKPCSLSSNPVGFPLEALSANGFGIMDLDDHYLQVDIKRVLQK